MNPLVEVCNIPGLSYQGCPPCWWKSVSVCPMESQDCAQLMSNMLKHAVTCLIALMLCWKIMIIVDFSYSHFSENI